VKSAGYGPTEDQCGIGYIIIRVFFEDLDDLIAEGRIKKSYRSSAHLDGNLTLGQWTIPDHGAW
jgi:hypothetical protein